MNNKKSSYLNGKGFIVVWNCPGCKHHNRWYLPRSREPSYGENSTHKLECEWCNNVFDMIKKNGKLVKI